MGLVDEPGQTDSKATISEQSERVPVATETTAEAIVVMRAELVADVEAKRALHNGKSKSHYVQTLFLISYSSIENPHSVRQYYHPASLSSIHRIPNLQHSPSTGHRPRTRRKAWRKSHPPRERTQRGTYSSLNHYRGVA